MGPGIHWLSNQGFWTLQLDIVGFLAILGEASVLQNGQLASLSKTCLLPRLIPAPQALIRTSRPERLKVDSGVAVGAHNGNVKHHINHITHILHQVAYHNHNLDSELEPYEVRCVQIDWAADVASGEKSSVHAAMQALPNLHSIDLPDTRLKSLGGQNTKVHNTKVKNTKARVRAWGSLALLAWLGCAESIALLVVSATQGDGMSLLACLTLSLVSTLVGLASYWRLELPERTEMRDVPAADVIIENPNGSFLIVRCSEEISRLYFHQEKCEYIVRQDFQYRLMSLCSTLLLMFGVICLANATQLLQVLWAVAYIILNAAYWIVAALPSRSHWDMGSFNTNIVDFEWYQFRKKVGNVYPPSNKMDWHKHGPDATFTEALWKVIAITKTSRWARTSDIAPNTTNWDNWLREAESAAKNTLETEKAQQDHAQRAVIETADIESQLDLMPTPPTKLVLPEWNYRAALDKHMRLAINSTW